MSKFYSYFFSALIFLLFSSMGVHASTTNTVKEVQIVGVTVFSQAQVETALEVMAGDPIDPKAIERSIDNLLALYEIAGYEKAEITGSIEIQKNDKNEPINVFKIQISEGFQTKIHTIKAVIDGIQVQKNEKLYSELISDIENEISIERGSTYNQAKVAEAKDIALRYLDEEEFYGSKLNKIEIKETTSISDPEHRWVDVYFHFDVGSKLSFGFKGNTSFSNSDLTDLIKEQKFVQSSDDYLQVLITKIVDEYKSIGRPHVKVRVFTFEKIENLERRVRFEIDEGPKVRIDKVEFDGNLVFSSDSLKREFFANASPIINSNIYVSADADKAAELLLEWIQSQGYLSAKLITVNQKFKDNGQQVDLLIYLYEGERTLINSIKVDNNSYVTEQDVKNYLGIGEGQPLNLFEFNEGLEELKIKYRWDGYLDFKILNENEKTVISYSKNDRYADVYLNFYEGVQYKISDIQIVGLEKTEEKIARRELQFNEGEILKASVITESEARLRRLGLFSTVSIQFREDPDRKDFKKVRVVLKEGFPGILETGFGIRNDLGIRLFGSTGYSNLWGENHIVSFSGSANRRFEDYCVKRGSTLEEVCFIEYQLRLAYTWPWFIVDEMSATPVVTQTKKRYRQFDSFSNSFQFNLEKRLFKKLNLVAGLTYSLERTRQFNSVNFADNQTLTIGAIIPSLTLDLRDNPLSPQRGFFATTSLEYAHPSLGSQTTPSTVGYTRVQLRADQFLTLDNWFTWFVSFRAGWEKNNLSPIGIPLSKQFALGGAGSLRGFRFQELNAQDQTISGSMSYVNYRTQIDFPITGDLHMGPFLDAGNLLINEFSFGNLRYGAGFGVHYRTPVGPVNFDWGFKIDPLPGEEPSAFYFSVGIL